MSPQNQAPCSKETHSTNTVLIHTGRLHKASLPQEKRDEHEFTRATEARKKQRRFSAWGQPKEHNILVSAPKPVLLTLIFVALISFSACGGGGMTNSTTPPSNFTIGGTVTGLSGTLVLADNGGNNLTITANGSFTFAGTVTSGTAYNVTATPPSGQSCVVTNGSGTATANVTNIQVACSNNTTTFTIGGTVSGLTGTGLVLQDNGGNNLSITASGSFTFTSAVNSGAPYNVTVLTQPSGQTCIVSNGSGTATSNVTNVQVSCGPAGLTISASVSGLSAGTLILQDDASQQVSFTTNTTQTFPNTYASGASYKVQIFQQPTGQTCSPTSNNTSGTITANVTITVNCIPNGGTTFTIGGTVSGLTGTGLVLQDNGGDNLAISADGSFTFATPVVSTYNVTVLTQPTGQTCSVTNGSGTATSNVTNVQVACSSSTNTFTISVSVTGLSGGTLILQDDATQQVSFTTNGTQTFSNTYTSGASYQVQIFQQPTGQTCSPTSNNTSGTITSNVTIAVNCIPNGGQTFTIGGTVSGLTSGISVVLQDNGGDNLTVSANGSFTFATALATGSPYNVTVLTQPAGGTCSVANGTGTVGTAPVTNVAVTCSATSFSIGGTVSGLTGTGLVLQDNGGDNLSISANGSFTFATKIASGGAYNVTVLTQPTGQTCSVTNGSGTATGNVTNVQVTCSATSFTIGGTLSGLTGGTVVLQDNGGDNLSISANGSFTFATKIASGGTYNVTVLTQPTGETCTVTNGSGTATANVTNVTVNCTTNTFTIGGTLSGLAASTTVVLQDNLTDNLSLSANGSFTFATALVNGSAYSVTVKTQPTGQTCTVTNGSGTVNNANVTNVGVACVSNTQTFTVGGTLSGLTSGTVVIADNTTDTLSLSADGSFTFGTALTSGSAYSVTVKTQPTGQTCTVTNGSGTINNANVTNVQVTCTSSSGNLTISVAVAGLSGSVNVSDDKGDTLTFNANGTQPFPSQYASGATYEVNVSSQPTAQSCTPTYSGGTITSNLTVTVTCATGGTRALGTVSNVSGISCSGAVANGTCQQMTVSCPGVDDVFAYVKTNTPTGTSIGTVTYNVGTDGNGLYDSIYKHGVDAVQNVINAGFTTVQISWGSPFNNNQMGGWVTGPGGVLAGACRYATVTQWIYDNIHKKNASLPLCATANSGGAGALAYALSQYPTSNILSMAEVTSGPPTGRLDWGCGCKEGSLPVSCGTSTTMGTCFGKTDSQVWDPAYTPSLNPSNPYCSNAAVNGTLPPGGLNYFLGDSAEAPGALYNYPHTFVNLLFGSLDTSSAIPIGQDWFNNVSNTSLKGQMCVQGAAHSMADSTVGADQIVSDITSQCKLH